MDKAFQSVLDAVQTLDDESRIAIAEKIMATLPENAEHDTAWRTDILRRLNEIEEGKVELFEAGDVMREARGRIHP